MSYLTDADYRAYIKDDILLDIIEGDLDLRDIAETTAKAEIASYLEGRYDMPATWALTGSNRDAALVMRVVDCTLYHLCSRIAPDQVPTLRKERYDAALDWLRRVARLELNPSLPVPADGSGAKFLYGSNPQRSHHF